MKNTTAEKIFKDAATIPEGFVYRDQKGRYPWWVKSVDKITTPVDMSQWEQTKTNKILMMLGPEKDQGLAMEKQSRQRMIEKMINNEPGSRLQDFALHYASETYFATGIDIFNLSFILEFFKIQEAVSHLIHPPEELGVPRWKGTELESSAMLEAAGIHLGASQVGFTALNPYWLESNVKIDPDAEKVTRGKNGQTLIPEKFQYVIVLAAQIPMAAQKRAPSQIGDAADRSGYENRQMAVERMINFIKGLGYNAMMMPGMMPPTIPFALMAGLGEMGRMNRLVSPLVGGAIRLETVLTDLPLALDKPIDFGLQDFCKGCKKCAKACPANALSMEDDPSWEPKGPYSTPGKKVWYDDCDRCASFTGHSHLFCGACLAACTWTKDNKTSLHAVTKAAAAKLPFMAPFMAFMDDVFGYGLVPEEKYNDWWNLKLPIKGFDSNRTRS
ncbi:MAG: reductive dehalogenase [Proteobacteria bacterium]|nr:reductive dehalogenase [Pseudomonadota bacterium]MBU4470773.1 reductive dehalogenase [Pseudomonadota bacterium]MCG2751499.1 reductive dehalogenase [Desulfobacteraceae bacterium]